jgi:hypothetical protein
MKPRTGANFDLRSSATIMPSGSEPMSVSAKIRKVFHMPDAMVESIVENVIIYPQFPFSSDKSSDAGTVPQHRLSVIHNLQSEQTPFLH